MIDSRSDQSTVIAANYSNRGTRLDRLLSDRESLEEMLIRLITDKGLNLRIHPWQISTDSCTFQTRKTRWIVARAVRTAVGTRKAVRISAEPCRQCRCSLFLEDFLDSALITLTVSVVADELGARVASH